MPLPPKLAREIAGLESKPEITEEGGVINLVFRQFPIPAGYNQPHADVLVRIPLAYPDAGPDMFWTSPQLSRQDGRPPQSAEVMESYIGQQWRRFSWHLIWKPNTDTLDSYIHFVRRGLERAC